MSYKLKVKHPEYGHVIFTEPTLRQEEILNIYNKIQALKDKYPNNLEFGAKVREILNK